ncbi:MAG: hypothetical protein K2X98_04460 [Alphaproteobacteria bacterium]|nr:hypothetical protein [Alphaproteobacteria bacterium]
MKIIYSLFLSLFILSTSIQCGSASHALAQRVGIQDENGHTRNYSSMDVIKNFRTLFEDAAAKILCVDEEASQFAHYLSFGRLSDKSNKTLIPPQKANEPAFLVRSNPSETTLNEKETILSALIAAQKALIQTDKDPYRFDHNNTPALKNYFNALKEEKDTDIRANGLLKHIDGCIAYADVVHQLFNGFPEDEEESITSFASRFKIDRKRIDVIKANVENNIHHLEEEIQKPKKLKAIEDQLKGFQDIAARNSVNLNALEMIVDEHNTRLNTVKVSIPEGIVTRLMNWKTRFGAVSTEDAPLRVRAATVATTIGRPDIATTLQDTRNPFEIIRDTGIKDVTFVVAETILSNKVPKDTHAFLLVCNSFYREISKQPAFIIEAYIQSPKNKISGSFGEIMGEYPFSRCNPQGVFLGETFTANSGMTNPYLKAVVQKFPKTKNLVIMNCPDITDFTPLESLEHLEKIWIHHCGLKKIPNFKNKNKLTYIRLTYNDLEFLDPLVGSYESECEVVIEDKRTKMTKDHLIAMSALMESACIDHAEFGRFEGGENSLVMPEGALIPYPYAHYSAPKPQ